jgi:hypothetical protein
MSGWSGSDGLWQINAPSIIRPLIPNVFRHPFLLKPALLKVDLDWWGEAHSRKRIVHGESAKI